MRSYFIYIYTIKFDLYVYIFIYFVNSSLSNFLYPFFEQLEALRQNEAFLGWTLGTFCSGTDCAVTCLTTLLAIAEQVLCIGHGGLPELDHVFSVEKDRAKQEFLRDFCPTMRHLYDDALQEVPEVAQIISAGFPCDDASALHPASATEKHRLCIAEAPLFLCYIIIN